MGKINGFTLSSRTYMHKGRPCKVFLPPIKINGIKYYWIQYLTGDKDVSIAEIQYLEPDKMAEVLYGEKEDE